MRDRDANRDAVDEEFVREATGGECARRQRGERNRSLRRSIRFVLERGDKLLTTEISRRLSGYAIGRGRWRERDGRDARVATAIVRNSNRRNRASKVGRRGSRRLRSCARGGNRNGRSRRVSRSRIRQVEKYHLPLAAEHIDFRELDGHYRLLRLASRREQSDGSKNREKKKFEAAFHDGTCWLGRVRA